MRTMPLSIGTIHFVGIGGIGMSGIAEILHNLGYRVQGSDIADNANVERLRRMGIGIRIGHSAEALGDARVVVVSSAVRPDNPEVLAARARLVPVVRRAEMLAELMRLKTAISIGGTHGKTTTTSLIAAMLDAARLDPTVINGGIINAYGTNARLGASDWMVVEADESDGSFLKLPSTAVVVTNIDPEHMDHYGSFDRLRDAFLHFVESIPFYGFAALCIDHPEVQGLIARVPDRKIVTYGLSPQAMIRAVNLRPGAGGWSYDVSITDRVTGQSRTIADLHLPMYGEHNVQNSLAAIAVAAELGLPHGIEVIDDYGHHPVEIAAVLKAARGACPDGQVVAVVQPHRYSRLASLMAEFCTCFNNADTVIVADVYAAGEAPLPGIDRDALVRALRDHGHRNVLALPEPAALPRLVRRVARPGDLVVCLGAGSITTWAQALPAALAALPPPPAGDPVTMEDGE
jgi:UDP-N-acetylmuramate--alanine ligase